MLASGNGTRQQCAANLVRTVRGEVPYERMKGINRELIDMPAADKTQIKASVSWVIKTYEPRIQKTTVDVTHDETARGGFTVALSIE